LRSLTLRLTAAAELGVRAKADTGALNDWRKEALKLRRVLKAVRDTDVFRLKLAGFSERVAEGTDQGDCCRSEIEQLDQCLKTRRTKKALAAQVEIAARCKRLKRLSKGLEAALEVDPPAAAKEARRLAREAAGEFPSLDGDNLHAYRKRLKQALYLAELGTDAKTRRLALKLRKMQGAVGDWHDWQALAERAKKTLPVPSGASGADGLVARLEGLAEEALRRALGGCRDFEVAV
jgi:CHAD domain-containing protein